MQPLEAKVSPQVFSNSTALGEFPKSSKQALKTYVKQWPAKGFGPSFYILFGSS